MHKKVSQKAPPQEKKIGEQYLQVPERTDRKSLKELDITPHQGEVRRIRHSSDK